jgi:hypothetical protein
MAGLNSGLRAGEEKLLDALMPEAANHPATSVLRNVTLHKSQMQNIYGVMMRSARSGATIWKCFTFQV